MFKKFSLVVALMLLASNAFAINVDAKVTSNTVSFNTVGTIVTFNSVTNELFVMNDASSTYSVDVYLNGDYIGWNATHSDYILPAVASYNSVILAPGDSVSVTLATKKFGYIGRGTGTIKWIATNDKQDI